MDTNKLLQMTEKRVITSRHIFVIVSLLVLEVLKVRALAFRLNPKNSYLKFWLKIHFLHLPQFEALYKCYVNKIIISLLMGSL